MRATLALNGLNENNTKNIKVYEVYHEDCYFSYTSEAVVHINSRMVDLKNFPTKFTGETL